MFSLRRIGARSDLTQAYRTTADLNQAPPQYLIYTKKTGVGTTMELVWLRSYPPGVPATVDVSAYRSIGDLFEATVAAHGARNAYVTMGPEITYRKLARVTARCP